MRCVHYCQTALQSPVLNTTMLNKLAPLEMASDIHLGVNLLLINTARL